MDKDDILSRDDRARNPLPRRVAVAAALIALLSLAIVRNLPHSPSVPSHPAHHHAVPPTRGGGINVAAIGVPGRPDGITGPTARWSGALRLPAAGTRPAWFSPATGRVQPIGGLPRSGPGYLFTRIDGGWAIQPALAAQVGCRTCSVSSAPTYFLGDGARSATKIGRATSVAPAAAAGAIWLTTGPRAADLPATAQEYGSLGTPVGPSVTLLTGYAIVRGTERGLLLARQTPRPGTAPYVLWDPARGIVTRTFPSVIAESRTEIAWLGPCDVGGPCDLRLLNLATGRNAGLTLPGRTSVANSAFSSDSRFLALQLSFGDGGDGGALAMQLDVCAVASGRLTALRGTWASSDAFAGFGWPDGSDSLVAELSFSTKVQLVAWHPGAARLAVATASLARHATASASASASASMIMRLFQSAILR